MPLYSFVCFDCKMGYEKLLRLEDWEKPVPCPHCGKALEKVIMAPRVIKYETKVRKNVR